MRPIIAGFPARLAVPVEHAPKYRPLIADVNRRRPFGDRLAAWECVPIIAG